MADQYDAGVVPRMVGAGSHAAPLLQLPDWCVGKLANVKTGGRGRKPLPTTDAQRRMIADAVHANGLILRSDTLTDGNCGADAILINLERLKLENAAQKLLRNLSRGFPRLQVIQALRFQLLIWVRDNQTVEVLPDVSLTDWILMEGYQCSGEGGRDGPGLATFGGR